MSSVRPVAVLHQGHAPPPLSGGRKPLKRGGYTDSSADIAHALLELGVPVVCPTPEPVPEVDLGWSFPDTAAGISNALAAGASVLWANTVLYAAHPLVDFLAQDLALIGHDPAKVELFDDKHYAKRTLAAAGCQVVEGVMVAKKADEGSVAINALSEEVLASRGVRFPAVLKPVRGRGSEGVSVVASIEELHHAARALFAQRSVINGTDESTFGKAALVENFLPGTEVTISVLPPGIYRTRGRAQRCDYWALPLLERTGHTEGVIPYTGTIPAVINSRAITEGNRALRRCVESCLRAAKTMEARALLRIDCRADEDGVYRIFDINLKPNLTGPDRPGREAQISLVAMAAREFGWTYAELVQNLLEQRWAASR